jgi:hypothetical protein
MAARVVCNTPSASRCPRWRGLARWSRARAWWPARIASRASLLAPLRPRGRFGPADHRPPTLAMVDQEPGQPGPIPARPFQRPHPPTWRLLAGQPEQPGMTGPVAWHLQGGPHPAVGVQQGRGVAVAVGIDPEGRRRPGPLPWAWRLLCPDGDRWRAPAWVGVTTRRQDGEESRPRADRLLHQASDDGGPGQCRQLEDRSAARHTTRRPARTGVTLPAGASLPAPRPGTTGSITARTTASARSMRSSGTVAGCTCTWAPAGTTRRDARGR